MTEKQQLPRLPLPLAELPQALQRFCNPDGPPQARLMAARGLVPVRGHDQVTLLAQLAADPDSQVKETALKSLGNLPDNVIRPACSAALHPAVLHLLAREVEDDEARAAIAQNQAVHDDTLEQLAVHASEQLAERMAVNQQRLITAPKVIEALYKNRNTRMSTADRLIEFAARSGLDLHGIPAFKAHVEALQGELIPEPSDEPLPQDQIFSEAVVVGEGEAEVFERDKVTGVEEVKKKFKPLSMQIADMSKAEKIRLAMVGTAAARALLVRDNNKQIAFAAIASPQTTVAEAVDFARSRDVGEDILRYISNKKDWVKSAEVKHNLVFNPKTPVGVSIKFLGHLRLDELRRLAQNRNVSGQLRSLAGQWVQRKEKR